MLLEGIFAAITTPFYPDGRLYLRKLEHNVDRYSRSPLSGMVVLGSTGEAVMLGDDESREVLKTAREAAAAEKVLLAGVGRESVAETLKLARFAADQRYDAVLVRTPNFYTPQMGDAAILNYYRMVADASELPVVLYNIPKFTKYNLSVEIVVELASHPNIIGLKDSSGSLDRIAAVVAATRSAPRRKVTVTEVFAAVTARMFEAQSALGAMSSTFVSAEMLGGGGALAMAPPAPTIKTRTKEVGFQVLSGSPDFLFESLEAGAAGGILALAAFAPQACEEIYTAWKDKDPELAQEKQERIRRASLRVAGELGIPGIKFACDLNGYYGGPPRMPLLPLTADLKAEITEITATLKN
ncbi:4-hydroxy-tetrahydrodipicolinate synthase [Acidisarcina polymorpha]|uniref:4-hydroxy-tetrahydrodipicolinate synthase n=1 Tax=Acidisarcina polymorpha TaxID=2211140 RepID=A0A2Z5GB63_9BACT|nr:dihydrodipicolinate synthase family protein [Acidisarcina polymorpha]AXC15876.1 4-hydroxy-tetrahydrodipicolinate synthase [Acidisarcina polymorpha]